MGKISKYLSFLALVLLFSVCNLIAAPSDVSLNGKVSSSGFPVDGIFDFRVSFYNSATGGIQTATDHLGSVTIDNGLFQISIPSTSHFSTSNTLYLYLELAIDIDNDGIGPEDVFDERIALSSVPYAQEADTLDGLSADEIQGRFSAASKKLPPFTDGDPIPTDLGNLVTTLHHDHSGGFLNVDLGDGNVYSVPAGEPIGYEGIADHTECIQFLPGHTLSDVPVGSTYPFWNIPFLGGDSYPEFRFEDGTRVNGVRVQFRVSQDWNESSDFLLNWIYDTQSGSSGDSVWKADHAVYTIGSQWYDSVKASDPNPSGLGTFVVPASPNVPVSGPTITIPATGISRGDFIDVLFYRDGLDSSDTMSYWAFLIYMEVCYEAE